MGKFDGLYFQEEEKKNRLLEHLPIAILRKWQAWAFFFLILTGWTRIFARVLCKFDLQASIENDLKVHSVQAVPRTCMCGGLGLFRDVRDLKER